MKYSQLIQTMSQIHEENSQLLSLGRAEDVVFDPKTGKLVLVYSAQEVVTAPESQ